MNAISSSNSQPSQPSNRQSIGYRVGHDLVDEGLQVKDLFVSLDNAPGLDHDNRKGFVDLQDPQNKFYDKAEIGTNQQGEVTSLTLSNNSGYHPSRTWTYDQNGGPTTLTINNPSFARKDQTVYHFDFGPDTEPWMEHIYQQ